MFDKLQLYGKLILAGSHVFVVTLCLVFVVGANVHLGPFRDWDISVSDGITGTYLWTFLSLIQYALCFFSEGSKRTHRIKGNC